MTINSMISQCANRLRGAGIASYQLDARIIIAYVLNITSEKLLAEGNSPVAEDHIARICGLCDRRQRREPLAYITGIKEFYSLKFMVTPDVLVPRPETELLVEYLIDNCPKNGAVLDLCTGSGAIAVTLKYERPDLTVTGSDISVSALEVARKNCKFNSVDKINFIESDLFEGITGKYDVIVSNPPYIPLSCKESLEPELGYEPQIALFSGEDGMDLPTKIINQAGDYLSSNGFLVMEIDSRSGEKIILAANEKNMGCELMPDLAGYDRIAVIRI
ncbi:MAG: peptide chain release factor N(5)-glutamine methyltransferase [Spirochaetes bacterium]|nr:peptide chain release factor N(5)-glutamine methyltransferase [Spirochaetota bacterium]MBN2769099.1 peptide chain release factor N(5)-glutamine methyltransferase [Spirochaetota bacterium]